MAQPPYGQPPQYPPPDGPGGDSGQYPQYGGQYPPPGGDSGQNPQYGGQYPPSGGQYPPGGQYPQYGGDSGQYPQYGQQYPQYGAPWGQYPPPGPVKTGNGFAVAGIILAIFLWPLGLIFAIIGLVKSGARAGAGKVLSIAAIVVAVVVGAASIAAVAAIGTSTGADPGCVSAESSFASMMTKIESDDTAMSADADNPAKEKTDVTTFTADVQTLITKLNAAKAEATHQSVKTAIGKASSDMSAMLSALAAVENGNASQLSVLENKASGLGGDGTAINKLCSSF